MVNSDLKENSSNSKLKLPTIYLRNSNENTSNNLEETQEDHIAHSDAAFPKKIDTDTNQNNKPKLFEPLKPQKYKTMQKPKHNNKELPSFKKTFSYDTARKQIKLNQDDVLNNLKKVSIQENNNSDELKKD